MRWRQVCRRKEKPEPESTEETIEKVVEDVVSSVDAGLVKMKVIFDGGAYIRNSPGYGPENEKIGTVDLNDIVTRNLHVEPVSVTHENGTIIEWVNLVSEYSGWIPTKTPDGIDVVGEYESN